MKKYYVTTAIDYANGAPHLGHAYEKILADAMVRTHRLLGEETYFLTGLDEHGQKVQQTAAKNDTNPQAWCDQMAVLFKTLCQKLEISYDAYARTTAPAHKKAVQDLLQRLFDEGQIYKSSYEGFYSQRAEQFLLDKDRNSDGSWPEIYGDVQPVVEENYFFRLSDYQEWLINHLNQNPDFIFPAFRRSQVLEFLKEPLNDLCISRPKSRLSWGIELPFDPEFVTYVWFDALLNYVTFAQYETPEFPSIWPADVHVIGKDILVPPHAVYWPIMLKAAGIPLPRSILAHGWWLSSGEKMSKSLGNVVEPLDVIQIYGVDAFRYFLLREMNVGQDSDFSLERFDIRYKSDLGNDLGNLLSRFLNMATRYSEGVVPSSTLREEPETTLQTLIEKTVTAVPPLYVGYQFHAGLEAVWELIRGVNRYAELRAPWKLAKSEDATDKARLSSSLFFMAEALRVVSVLLAPTVPGISEKIRHHLGLPETVQLFKEASFSEITMANHKILSAAAILFPRVE